MKQCLTFLFSLLLAGSLFGQQDQTSSYDSLLAAAQQAQAANNYVNAAASYKLAVKMRPDLAELRANLGLMQHQAGNYTEAIRSFQEAHRLKPTLYVPNLFLGIDYVQLGKSKEAIPFLLRAEKLNVTDTLPSYTLGRAYISLGEYAPAILELRRTVQIDPKLAKAWFDLGIAELQKVEEDARTLTADPESSFAKALFAESLVKQSRYKKGARLYEAILAGTNQPPCMRSEAGWLYLKQEDTKNAKQQFDAERNEHPECSLAILGQARLLIEAGANKDAFPLLQQAFSRDSGFLTASIGLLFDRLTPDTLQDFLNYLAQQQSSGNVGQELYATLTQTTQSATPIEDPKAEKIVARTQAAQPGALQQGREQYSAGHYQQCASLLKNSSNSGNAAVLKLLAACSYFTGDYTLTSDAARALQSLPSSPQAEALYWSISANGKLAFESLARFEQLEPNSARSHILLGDIYRQRERYDEAQKEYSKALDVAPHDTASLLGLASSYYGSSNLEKTIETAQKALMQSPEDPEVNLLMGKALISQRKFNDAAQFLLKSLNVKPQTQPYAHALLGRAYAGSGKNQDAMRELKLGAKSDQDGSIHYLLARLYTEEGDTADASLAIQQMKVLRDKRLKAAVIDLQEADTASPDDAP